MSAGGVLLLTAGWTAAAMGTLWLVSLARRNASIVDVYWGPGFASIAWIALLAGDAGARWRPLLAVALTTVWGLRLGSYLLWRNWGKGEDFRYAAMRRHWGDRFPIVSLVTVFLLQGVLMWIVSLPIQAVQFAPGPQTPTAADAVGLVLWSTGLFFEAVGDWQLARFKSDPANAGAVMDRGLWRYTRHPNYFGDCCVWWGLYAFSLATPYWPWLIVSPLIMSVLLMRVSGVPMLERTIRKRRPAYEAYAQRTSAFSPRPPRREA